MAYFVTGATGFIGSYLVAKLVKRRGPVYALVRKSSLPRLAELREAWGVDDKQVIAIVGDLAKPNLGVTAADTRKLKGRIKHFFHLAAIYDLKASAEDQQAANVDGTRHAVEFATAIDAGCFHHMSSIAAAGLYEGVFREDMFEEAEELDHPYFRTKHDAEGVVRRECKQPYRIYRPGFVVGDSKTGQIDKIDGPYYFFKTIQKMREMLPPWMPTIGIEGGRINIVPVDFVTDALDYLAHKKGLDGQCFHLTDPQPHRVGEVLNIFARAAHAPQMTMRINAKMFGFIPAPILYGLGSLAPVKRAMRVVLNDLGIPRDVFQFVNWPTRYDNREAAKALIEKMPPVFACPSTPHAPGETPYRVFLGNGAAFEMARPASLGDFTDGTSGTLLVVEASQAEAWTRPEGLDFNAEGNPAELIGSGHTGGVNALFADGSVRFLLGTVAQDTLKALITRGGGETVPADAF